MLTREDIENLIKAEKEIFVTKQDLQELEDKLSGEINVVKTSVDGLVKIVKNNGLEIKSLNYRVTRLEEWTEKAAPKIGIDLKDNVIRP